MTDRPKRVAGRPPTPVRKLKRNARGEVSTRVFMPLDVTERLDAFAARHRLSRAALMALLVLELFPKKEAEERPGVAP